ncbi:MAG TPA: metallophosphoesterase [Bacteroidia bacterium]|nr:metallophosphoesterase [Bacteroidia bacterium]
MNFVIGDIHGEYTKLRSLIENIRLIDRNAQLIFIGDYLDKGENVYKTLHYLVELSNEHKCIFIRGNHEYYWELLQKDTDTYADYLLKYGGKNTIQSLGNGLSIVETKEKLFSEFNSFFEDLQNFHILDNFVITHSGIPPELYDKDLRELKTEQLVFNRYAFICNQNLYQQKKLIFGHTGFYSPFYDAYKIGIDTAACYLEEQPLTAFCTDGNFFINSKSERFHLSTINQLSCPAIPRVKAWRQQ